MIAKTTAPRHTTFARAAFHAFVHLFHPAHQVATLALGTSEARRPMTLAITVFLAEVSVILNIESMTAHILLATGLFTREVAEIILEMMYRDL
jgi:hypothetical protein